MKQKNSFRIAILVIGISLMGGLSNLLLININYENVPNPGIFKSDVEIHLNCTLPDQTGISIHPLTINSANIDTAEEANDLTYQILPEYGDSVFPAEYTENFTTNVDTDNNSWIEVLPSGCLLFTRESNGTMVNIESFCETEALQIADDYIENHGTIQGATLDLIAPTTLWDENDTFTGLITGYTVIYRFSYNDIKIRGGDKILLYIDGNRDVTHYYWLKRDISESSETNTILSGQEAYDSLINSTTMFKGIGTLSINSAELCYYSEPYTENQDVMMPVWAFEYNEDNMYIYVDAVTGNVKF